MIFFLNFGDMTFNFPDKFVCDHSVQAWRNEL